MVATFDLNNGELALVVVIPEPMVFDQKVLGAVGKTLVRGERVAAEVVFTGTGADGSLHRRWNVEDGHDFNKDALEGKESLE